MINEPYVVLTAGDHSILESYKHMLSGLGEYLGIGYEVILHSLENLDHSVIKIVNGHYSGRKEGAPITDFALSMLKKIQENKDYSPIIYLNKDKKSTVLKSTTIPIVGEKKKIIGLVCINFYTDVPLYNLLSSFMTIDNYTNPEPIYQETFSENIDDVIVSALTVAKEEVYNDYNITSQNKNKEIIVLLYEKGIFNIKDAVIKVAELLNISKNTVYMHLRNIKSS